MNEINNDNNFFLGLGSSDNNNGSGKRGIQEGFEHLFAVTARL